MFRMEWLGGGRKAPRSGHSLAMGRRQLMTVDEALEENCGTTDRWIWYDISEVSLVTTYSDYLKDAVSIVRV